MRVSETRIAATNLVIAFLEVVIDNWCPRSVGLHHNEELSYTLFASENHAKSNEIFSAVRVQDDSVKTVLTSHHLGESLALYFRPYATGAQGESMLHLHL